MEKSCLFTHKERRIAWKDYFENSCIWNARTGMNTLGRTVRAMIAETPMMKNLKCPEYMKIILNGQPTLAARFAELDMKRIRERATESQNEEALPSGIKKIIKIPNFYKVFMKPRSNKTQNTA